jgi:RNA polymerase sigma factor for flagellar operon FliA
MNNPRSELLSRHSRAGFPEWPRIPQHSSSRATAGDSGAASADTLVKDEALFLENLPVIDAAIGQVCRRHRLTPAEADDFASEVRLHFIERNYEPLRKFEGRSTLRTYLIVVVQHLFLDYRNRLWGKWRPSAEAKRQGAVAILVERLVLRDGWTVDQATEALRTNHGIEPNAALHALFVKLASRAPAPQLVAEREADSVESPGQPADANVLRAEHGFFAKRVQTALDRVRQALTAEERLILKMRFEDAVPVADIARALHLNQKRLYRTIEQLLATLRHGLEAEGIDRDEITALFANGVIADVEPVAAAQPSGVAGTLQPAERTRAPWRT